jgi:hypothetical protein
MTTNLRCKEGDLAVITQEEIGCEANIGRFVYVIRRAEPYSDFDPMDEWWIESASDSPLVFLKIGETPRQIGCDSNPVRHSDRWLRPIRDPGDYAVDEVLRKLLLKTSSQRRNCSVLKLQDS